MAVRRSRPRPQTSVTPGGPFAEEEQALDLLVSLGNGGNGTNGKGNGGGEGQTSAPAPAPPQQRLEPLEVTWLRRRGERVRKDQELATVRCRLVVAGSGGGGEGAEAPAPEVTRKLLASRTGTLEEVLTPSLPLPADAGTGAGAGEPPTRLVLGKVVYCTHPCLRDDRMCAVCGEVAPDLGQAHHGEGGTTRVFVKGGHHVSVSMTEAASLYKSMAEQLQKARKLHLVLDIDLTLLHATIDPRAQALKVPESLEVHSFDVMSFGRPLRHWCCLRPGLRRFLDEAKALYVLTIYTHGRRDYAHQVAKVLDPDKTLFGDRIVSRDDCPDLHGQKSLQRLFPGGIEMALILDDSPQVWQGEQSRHLLPVLPFKFYTEFEEVNRVQGLAPSPSLKVFGDPKEDTQLAHTWRVLQEVHGLYYHSDPPPTRTTDGGCGAQQHRPKNVAGCLATVRKRILAGCSVVFSGLLPRGLDPRRTDLGYMATALGAAVTEGLTERTTHVVAENPSTEKVYHARQRGDAVAIVTRAWLQLSFWHMERKPEAQFPLVGKKAGAPVVAPVAKPDALAEAAAVAYTGMEEGSESGAAAAEAVGEGEGRASKRAKVVAAEEEQEQEKGDAQADSKAPAAVESSVAVAMEEGGDGEEADLLEQALADELG